MASTAQAMAIKPPVRLQASVASFEEDGKLLGLAREIAMDIQSIDVILANHGMSAQRFAEVRKLPRFVQYMEHEVLAWGTSLNASQRVKVKSITLIEEWLAHLNQEMHAPTSTLAAKVEAGKLVARLGGLGLNLAAATATEAGEQFSVTINMGNDKQVKIGMTKPVGSGQGGQNVGGGTAGRDEYGTPVDDDGYSYSYIGDNKDRVYEDNEVDARKVTPGKTKGSGKSDSWATTGDKWAEIVNAELGAGDV